MKWVPVKWVPVKFVPHLLTKDLQEELKNGPQFLTKVVTGDESWCYGRDPESKQQSRQWKSPNLPRPKKSVAGSLKCQDNVDFSLSLSLSQMMGQGTGRWFLQDKQ